MPAPFEGGCRCGDVRYVCDVEPVQVAYCHCRECQYASGGAYATVVLVPAESLRVSGELRDYDDRGASGKRVTRSFCPRCGTPIVSSLEAAPALRALRAASLDDPGWLAPSGHVWFEEAQPWSLSGAALPRHARMPGDGEAARATKATR